MKELPAALQAMRAFDQFVVYLVKESKGRPGKTDKFPCDYRSGNVVSSQNPAFWTDFNTASEAAAKMGPQFGVGFVLTESDPFWLLDIDNCLIIDHQNPEKSDWSHTAKSLCMMFAGAAIERSRSLVGLHVIGRGTPPPHSCKNGALNLEFYSSKRFIALTGIDAIGDAWQDFSEVLPQFINTYFPPSQSSTVEQAWTDTPSQDWNGPSDDEELIRRALRSQSTSSAFEGKASFADLWKCNTEVLSKCYPDPTREYDANRADAALAQHLAFWTGKNCERIDRLMRKSMLVREKWERKDYLPRTILQAVGRQIEVLSDKPLELPERDFEVSEDSPKPKQVTGSRFANIEEQLKIFAGCVYVRGLHKVLIPGGELLKPDQFRVEFGGYQFIKDMANEKSTKDAWEAFTQNQAFRPPIVDDVCFRPDLKPGYIFEEEGNKLVNSYWPVDVPRKKGDPAPFLNHLNKVLPDERDSTILLSYMAACVQYKGVKFQWAPLIQGVEGNGKTLFTLCVAKAIGGKYVHWPRASELSSKFNSWLFGKILYGVEDVYFPKAKFDIIEELKPMITGGGGLTIEGKNENKFSAQICGNFIFNSNHKNAIPKTKNGRRYCVFYSAQQSAEDLIRDGMTEKYFVELYGWLKKEGHAIVSEFLHTWKIPEEYNPATKCIRAPQTSSTELAIEESKGHIEQEIQEAIDQGLPGFKEGWISSIQLENLLQRMGVSNKVSRKKRKEILNDLGYIYHPFLKDGRVDNPVMPDNGKPRLFIRNESPDVSIKSPSDVAKAYEMANNHSILPFFNRT